jgi:hypothetical protein
MKFDSDNDSNFDTDIDDCDINTYGTIDGVTVRDLMIAIIRFTTILSVYASCV